MYAIKRFNLILDQKCRFIIQIKLHIASCFQTILTHSKSRVVLQAMKEAVANNKIFEVYVTSSSPDNIGYILLLCLFLSHISYKSPVLKKKTKVIRILSEIIILFFKQQRDVRELKEAGHIVHDDP